MALIQCPECKKEVSERAYSCPICGFPLNEYFEEQSEKQKLIEEEKARKVCKEYLIQKSVDYAKRTKFVLNDKEISFDQNEKICALIGANFQFKEESIHRKIQELLLSEDNPADMNEVSFSRYIDYLVQLLCEPLIDECLYWSRKFTEEDEMEELEECICSAFSHDNLRNKLFSAYVGAKRDYDLKCDNAHLQYHDEYYAAGTPAQPIKEIYSSTLSGLVAANISARLVNGVTRVVTEGGVKKREEKAQNKYYETVYKERLICNTIIYSALDNFVDSYVKAYKGLVLDCFVEKGELFEKKRFS